MSEHEKIWESPVYKGMLRTTRLWGVPYEGFIFNAFISVLVFFNVSMIFALLFFPAMHIFLYLVTHYDPDFIEIVSKSLQFSGVKSRFSEGADTYVP